LKGVNIKRSNDNLLRSQIARLGAAFDPNKKLNLMVFGQIEIDLIKIEE